jgi:hypothetical protein
MARHNPQDAMTSAKKEAFAKPCNIGTETQ